MLEASQQEENIMRLWAASTTRWEEAREKVGVKIIRWKKWTITLCPLHLRMASGKNRTTRPPFRTPGGGAPTGHLGRAAPPGQWQLGTAQILHPPDCSCLDVQLSLTVEKTRTKIKTPRFLCHYTMLSYTVNVLWDWHTRTPMMWKYFLYHNIIYSVSLKYLSCSFYRNHWKVRY